MQLFNVILLIFSSFLYATIFIFNVSLWWLIFLCFVPFLYVIAYCERIFWYYFIWSLVALSLHMVGGIYVVTQMASIPFWGFLLSVGVVFFQVCFITALFFTALILINFFSLHEKKLINRVLGERLCIAVFFLFFFITWIDQYCLCFFDVIEGYPLMHPLLVLVHCPALLYLLPFIGKNCLTLFLLLFSASIINMIMYKNSHTLLFFIGTLLLWLISYCLYSASEIPAWAHTIKPLSYMIVQQSPTSKTVVDIALYEINQLIAVYDDYEIFVLPESAIDCRINLQKHDYDILCHKHVICGVSHMQEAHCLNSCMWLHDKKVRYSFNKKHAMVLSERLPMILQYTLLKNLYCNKAQEINISANKREKININDSVSFVPYICSELFFSESSDDEWPEAPILLLVNDSVFLHHYCSQYIAQLLQLLARFRAIQWQRDIVYVSYSQSLYCGKHGECMYLP